MGGDEFSILIASCHHYEINPLLSHIDHCFNQSVWLGEGKQVKVGTSIGIARYPLDSDDIEQLLTLADQNMYEMKFARPKAFRATGSYS
ncbi:transcriptional regulator CdgA [Vibrio astriarenae]|nr:transcriptional regulator CdgA [Vibrio sp. C7]